MVFPSRLDPISNITGFTYRTGSTYQEILMRLSEYIQTTMPEEFNASLGKFFTDFSTALGENQETLIASQTEQDELIAGAIAALNSGQDTFETYINSLVDLINDKSGPVAIQRTTLTGPHLVTVDPLWPDNQPVDIVLTQDGTGNRAVTFDTMIEGTAAVAKHPGSITALTLVPGGDGTWTVVQIPELVETAVHRQDLKTAHRVWVGARVGMPDDLPDPDGAAFFDQVHLLESEMGATFDAVNWYASVNDEVVDRFTTEVVPELTANPDRKLMYALEIWRSNDAFLAEFDSQGDIYDYLVALFGAMKDHGLDDRIHLAPFHEGNGPGGTYPWQMNDTSNGNSVAKYADCFERVVTLARSMGLRAKFIQWFLTSNGGGADDSRDISKGYVGDAWVDIIGVSYYNRAVAGASETAVGGTLTRFMRHVEKMTPNPVWICETGCYPSVPGEHDKGVWYADLIRLASSDQFPRLEAVCLFMQWGATTDKRLENTEQKRRVGKAINDSHRSGSYGNPADLTRNLIPRSIAVPAKASDWTKYAADGLPDLTLSITANVPDNVDKINTSLRITKPMNIGLSTDYRVYRSVAPGDVDFELQKTHTTGFWARASYDGFKLGFGVRQSGGNLVAGDSRIELTTQWEYYNTPFATNIDPGSFWQFPHMSFGDNVAAGWFEITDMQIARGNHPTPDVAKVLVPRVREAANAGTYRVNCESADTWIITLTADRLLDAPVGAAYDGQLMTLRIRQDATGTRTLTRSTDPRWFVSSESMTGGLTTAPFSQTLVTLMYFADQDKWGITKVTRMNFT